MKLKKTLRLETLNSTFAVGAAATALFFLIGCGKAEKEKEPVVTVQTTPAQRGPISQVVSAEAVV